MSKGATIGTTALNKSGLWMAAAATTKPPLEPPVAPNFSGLVYLFSIKYSAAEQKSSNEFCLKTEAKDKFIDNVLRNL